VKDITTFITHKPLFVISLGIITLLLIVVSQSNLFIATSKAEQPNNIPLYYFSTRIPPNPQNIGEQHNWFGTDNYLDINQLTKTPCQSGTNRTVAIFVHGWEKSEEIVKERLNRVKLSLEKDNYIGPLVGYSWPPNPLLWYDAKFDAKEEGPKLANLILELKSACPKADIRIIAHSLGARVVLSSLENLKNNTTWNAKNFKITSVDLVGAAVDNEEVSTNRNDIDGDLKLKEAYGDAIDKEVIKFHNLFSSKDNMLEPNPGDSYPVVYPSTENENDSALGQSGAQKNITIPKNYNDTNVTEKLVASCDADGDGHPDYPFSSGNIITSGDNHRGYLGYRDNGTKSITNDGAIDVVVKSWNIKPTNENVNLNPVCPNSSTQ
jgi:Alpha/beta hydrolase of unknown function (DUF900)